MFGKLDYWRIYFSLTAKAALSLLNSCSGSARGGGRKAAFAGGLLLQLGGFSSSSAATSRTGRAGSEQQLASLLVCPQEDEASQADGCHPRDDTCEQAEGEGKAVSEDERMPHGWLQGLWKTKSRKILSCWFLKSHPAAH